ncbi:HAD-like superfamily [Arabidopsis thaliana x Arabidopsis arenosa]|uniref:RNA polymerase II C-terminal domain phosphatase-like n=1 Tax=Arabidopsis thaliana x Arabidopsis arenosa TaxID=1240361 RepID=A0A8T1Z0A7_9BRAS|nr:HAD-like superfamily [Arabidopsis thaliana x Arabidopsis arenosa]
MSLVENPSLEPQSKTRKIDTEIKETTSRNCQHWFVRNRICISCNTTLDNYEGRSFDYLYKVMHMSHEALVFTKRVISQTSWLEDKKLHLVLDLDHTLVHTIKASQLSESEKYLTEEVGSRKDLWRFNSGFPEESLIKLRPFVHQFLKECSEMFSMYVYTKGGCDYAQVVLELIDPEKIYFGNRVITRRESPGLKTLDLVLADERGVVIVDDKCSVWPHDKKNLLQIAKYKYFGDQSCSFSECKKKRDESEEKGPLDIVLRFLKDVHNEFFCDWSRKDLDSVDVRPLLKEISSRWKRKAEVVV